MTRTSRRRIKKLPQARTLATRPTKGVNTRRAKKVVDILERIQTLLALHGEKLWASRVAEVIDEVRREGRDPSGKVFREIRRNLLGTMGSLMDAVMEWRAEHPTPQVLSIDALLDDLHYALKPDY